MTTTRLFALLLVVMGVTMVVARTRGDNAPAEAATTYVVRGVLTAAPADGRVMVAHEEIPGYMPAMIMPFTLDPSQAPPRATAGDTVRFTLALGASGPVARDLVVTGHDGRVAAAVRGGGSHERRLKRGDVVPDFALVDQRGAAFPTSRLRGRVSALTFIFTRCPVPDFCPLMVKRFQQVQRVVGADASLSQVQLLSVSLDPEFDTPEVLHAYAAAMQADATRWQFLTGTSEAVKVLTQAFAVHVERNGVLLDHTLATAVIDGDGRIVEIWRGNGWRAEEVVEVLKQASAR